MRIARITTPAGVRYAAARDENWAVVDDPYADELLYTGEVLPIDGTPLLAPVDPRVVVGIAHNRALREHALPIQAWLKSPRTIIGPGDGISLRRDIGTVNIEGELAVVIGKTSSNLTLENALDAVLGYTVANDVTNIDRVPIDEKNFEPKAGGGYTPIGPWIETAVDDAENVPTTVSVNGVVRAESGSFNLQSTVAACLVYVTSWLELGPGDLVLTGAPATIVPVTPGDTVHVTLGGIGTLTNTVN